MGRFARLADQMGDIERLAWEEVWIYAEGCSAILREMPHHKRKRATSALIADMLEAQDGICPICHDMIDRSTLGAHHVDHIIPFSHGGGYERENLQVVHPSCNLSKGNTVSLEDLIPYLERKVEELS